MKPGDGDGGGGGGPGLQYMNRGHRVPCVVRANVAKSPWVSGAVRNLGLLEVRGDQLFHLAAVLSDIYSLNSFEPEFIV